MIRLHENDDLLQQDYFWKPLPDFGCFVGCEGTVLYSVPMMKDGSISRNEEGLIEWTEVVDTNSLNPYELERYDEDFQNWFTAVEDLFEGKIW